MSATAAKPMAVPASEAGGYLVPSLGHRILVATLGLIPSFFLVIALPVAALTFVSAQGIAVPIPVDAVIVGGVLLLGLGAARSILKPTAAYGPLSIATSLVALLYLAYLVSLSPYRFGIPGGSASVAAGYSTFLELAMIVPALGVLAGILTTWEDAHAPKERLPFDYPA